MQHKHSNALWIQHAEVLVLCLFTWMTFSSSANHKRSMRAHLRQLFGKLQEHGLVISLSKCQFGVNEIDFLGHHVNQQGVFPLPEKVDAIRSFPRPTTVKQLQEYLFMVNFYHRFVPSAAALMQPLYKAIDMKHNYLFGLQN